MNKFTPAPWVVETYELDMWGVYTPDGELIADCGYEQEANARLIAVAPEMYELLKEELVATSDYGGILSFEREAKIRKLLAHIDSEETEV